MRDQIFILRGTNILPTRVVTFALKSSLREISFWNYETRYRHPPTSLTSYFAVIDCVLLENMTWKKVTNKILRRFRFDIIFLRNRGKFVLANISSCSIRPFIWGGAGFEEEKNDFRHYLVILQKKKRKRKNDKNFAVTRNIAVYYFFYHSTLNLSCTWKRLYDAHT